MGATGLGGGISSATNVGAVEPASTLSDGNAVTIVSTGARVEKTGPSIGLSAGEFVVETVGSRVGDGVGNAVKTKSVGFFVGARDGSRVDGDGEG